MCNIQLLLQYLKTGKYVNIHGRIHLIDNLERDPFDVCAVCCTAELVVAESSPGDIYAPASGGK